jgi:hypothetical protein
MDSTEIKFKRIEIDPKRRRMLSAHLEFGGHNRGILRAIGAANGRIAALEKAARKSVDAQIPANTLWDRAGDLWNGGEFLVKALIEPGETLNMSAEERSARGKAKKKED